MTFGNDDLQRSNNQHLRSLLILSADHSLSFELDVERVVSTRKIFWDVPFALDHPVLELELTFSLR